MFQKPVVVGVSGFLAFLFLSGPSGATDEELILLTDNAMHTTKRHIKQSQGETNSTNKSQGHDQVKEKCVVCVCGVCV